MTKERLSVLDSMSIRMLHFFYPESPSADKATRERLLEKIGIVYHPMIEPAGKLARELASFLAAKKVNVWTSSAWETAAVKKKLAGTDLLLTVGGDGTILRAAQAVLPGKVPITGINLGKLGFMTELGVEETRESLRQLLAGKGWRDERALLEVKIKFPAKKTAARFYALNDVVVARGAVIRVISVAAEMNGAPLTTYKGDGVIMSTATGSTGYALAAGGPILQPRAREMVLVPIMPHLAASYPLVLPADTIIRLQTQSVFPATISIDGHTNITAGSGTVLELKRSAKTICFLRIHPETYFYSSLESRLKGKQS